MKSITFDQTSNIMMASITKMQIFSWIQTNFEGDKTAFKRSYDKQNLTLGIIFK